MGKFFHLGTFLLIGRGDIKGQQMPQGIYRDVRFAAFFAFMPIIARPFATLGR